MGSTSGIMKEPTDAIRGLAATWGTQMEAQQTNTIRAFRDRACDGYWICEVTDDGIVRESFNQKAIMSLRDALEFRRMMAESTSLSIYDEVKDI